MNLMAESEGGSTGRPGHLLRRLRALSLDLVVVGAYIGVLSAVFLGAGAADASAVEAAFADPVRAQLTAFVLLTLPVILYFTGWEAHRGATPGKRVAGIRVVGHDGGPVGWSRALGRSALRFLPWELAHTSLWRIPGWPGEVVTIPTSAVAGFAVVWILVGLYLLVPLLRSDRRTPYDLIAGTFVVSGDESRARLSLRTAIGALPGR